MEAWALPAHAVTRLVALERDLGEERVAGPDGAFLRGGHWRNFLVKYPEANRMHKKMLALSALCRERGDPPAARRAIGRSQCNDAYWHGVFGGLYLPHLRAAIWRNLALAEGELRRGEGLAAAARAIPPAAGRSAGPRRSDPREGWHAQHPRHRGCRSPEASAADRPC